MDEEELDPADAALLEDRLDEEVLLPGRVPHDPEPVAQARGVDQDAQVAVAEPPHLLQEAGPVEPLLQAGGGVEAQEEPRTGGAEAERLLDLLGGDVARLPEVRGCQLAHHGVVPLGERIVALGDGRA